MEFRVFSNNKMFIIYEVTIDEDGDVYENQIFNLEKVEVNDISQAYSIYMKDIIKDIMEEDNCDVADAITKIYIEDLDGSDFFDGYTFDMLPKDIQEKLADWVRSIAEGTKLAEYE